VNEAYVRLIDQRKMHWQNRAQFFGVAATLMRRILVGYARSRHYAKRAGNARRISLDEALIVSEGRSLEVVAVDDALTTWRLYSFRFPWKQRESPCRLATALGVTSKSTAHSGYGLWVVKEFVRLNGGSFK
jgi:hypothetical protein